MLRAAEEERTTDVNTPIPGIVPERSEAQAMSEIHPYEVGAEVKFVVFAEDERSALSAVEELAEALDGGAYIARVTPPGQRPFIRLDLIEDITTCERGEE